MRFYVVNMRRCLAEGNHYNNFALPVFPDFFFSKARDMCQREIKVRKLNWGDWGGKYYKEMELLRD